MRIGALAVLGLSLNACSSDTSEPPRGSHDRGVGGAAVGGTEAGGTHTSNGGASGGGQQARGGGGNGGSAGNAGAATNNNAGAAGDPGAGDPPAPRPLQIAASKSCKCELKFSAKSLDSSAGSSANETHENDEQAMKFDASKPARGKLVIVLGGIGGGPGPGGIYGYAISKGYHAFLVATQTKISSAPDQYKNKADAESNRQVGDARLEAWDGKDRVDWLDVKRPDSVERRTELALKYAQEKDPGADWAYYLNADGSVRWSDVFMVGFSFGSQTIAMVSKYVRFGRALLTSGPTDEEFPKATWLSQVSATPLERMYMMVGATVDYPPSSGDVGDKIETAKAAGWLGEALNVHKGATGRESTPPFNDAHMLVLVGQGHSEMCAGDGGDWKAVCDYGFNVLE
jgi:hypothetical protein